MTNENRKIIFDLTTDFSRLEVSENFKHRILASINISNNVVIGMRRLGKTEYLKYIYSSFKNKDKAIYINIDSPKLHFIDFSSIESESKKVFLNDLFEIIEKNKIELLLIDEIQLVVNWSRLLKGIIDQYPYLTVVATGSDAHLLNSTNERGGTRYKIYHVGPITFSEYVNMHDLQSNKDKMSIMYEHIDKMVFPSQSKYTNGEMFDLIYEKQFSFSNFSKRSVRAVIKAFALNPGSGISMNSLSKIIKQTSGASPDNKQIRKIVDFLIESDLIYEIWGFTSLSKASKGHEAKYYPSNWNLYKLYIEGVDYRDLNEIDNPRKGFVFENYVITNIISSSITQLERENIYYGNDESNCDVVVNEVKYEIKSFDIFYSESAPIIIAKAKQHNLIIIHTGETKEFEGVRLINVAEFLENKMWMYLKNR